jgi:hypothetical protein
MSRFFFDFEEGGHTVLDREGTEFADVAGACLAAFEALPDIVRDGRSEIGVPRQLTVIVRDQSGRTIYRAVLSLAGEWVSGTTA